MIKLIECPRDAMQGLATFIPTEIKIAYINLLLEVGFDTIDFGSFVSAKKIPQLRDTVAVLDKLKPSSSKLLAIVANLRGIQEAIQYEPITYLGFPFSISETFQQRNTHASIEQSLLVVEQMMKLCDEYHKKVIVYLSMGFGNPYGDPWTYKIVEYYTSLLEERGVQTLSLADTVGMAHAEQIRSVFSNLKLRFSKLEFGVHLHSGVNAWEEKVAAAYESGCLRFDGAIGGWGGCPMANDALVGNIATENLINYFNGQGEDLQLDMNKWQEAIAFSDTLFTT